MNTPRSPLDTPDDLPGGAAEQELARKLQAALAAPAMDPAWAQALRQQLDARFRDASAGLNGHASLARLVDMKATGWATDGEAPAIIPPGGAPLAPHSGAPDLRPPDPGVTHSRAPESGGRDTLADLARTPSRKDARTLGRWFPLASAAAVLLVVGVWSNQPVYSWQRMIDAMGRQAWVQAAAVLTGGGRLVQWVSAPRQVSATRVSGQRATLYWVDAQRETLQVFREGQDAIAEAPLSPNGAAQPVEIERNLLACLAPASMQPAGIATGAGGPTLEARTEGWRRLTKPPGRVELRVALHQSDRVAARLRVVVDAKSHLPESCEVVEPAPEPGRPAARIDFDYPASGPSSLEELGAPAGTRVDRLEVEAGAMLASLESRPAAAAPPTDHRARLDPPPGPDPDAAVEPPSAPARPGGAQPEAQPETQPEAEAPLPPPLADEAFLRRLDETLAALWRAQGVTPAPASGDAEFLRRVSLDLTGRIPTVGEARLFLDDRRPDRRRRLVEQLLESRDHATHAATLWRKALVPPAVDLTPYGGPENLDEWLADRFQQNQPYDALTRDLLLAEGRIADSGPLLFYAAHKLNAEEIAAQVSRTFLGMQMECAQCHDHPFDERIGQHDFWAFAALFARISRPQGMLQVASPVMRVSDSRWGEVKLPGSEEVVAPRLPLDDAVVSDAETGPSRRRQLADWLTSPGNERFARAAVNRVWAHMFGRGLVEPVDDLRAANPPVSPETLDLLAAEFARGGYDLRRVWRVVALSRAYQLTSRSDAAPASPPGLFARMHVKPFTAEQLYDAIQVATRTWGAGARSSDLGLARTGDASRGAFIELFGAPGAPAVEYHAGIPQALTLMHGGMVHNATDLSSSGLLRGLRAPFFTDAQRVEALFLATLSRPPTADEAARVASHLAGAQTEAQRGERLGDALWALLNTAEFSMNH